MTRALILCAALAACAPHNGTITPTHETHSTVQLGSAARGDANGWEIYVPGKGWVRQ